jgi:hypothetical protein
MSMFGWIYLSILGLSIGDTFSYDVSDIRNFFRVIAFNSIIELYFCSSIVLTMVIMILIAATKS